MRCAHYLANPHMLVIGVRSWLGRAYVILASMSKREIGQTPAFYESLEISLRLGYIIQLPTALLPPCLALAQKSVRKSSANHAKSVRIEAWGTSQGHCGALLGFPLAQRAKNIQKREFVDRSPGPIRDPKSEEIGPTSSKCVPKLCSKLDV